MEIIEKLKNSEEDNIILSSDELDGLIFIPSDFSENIKCTTDVKPSEVSDEVDMLSKSMSVDKDVLYDMLTPIFGDDAYEYHQNYLGFDELEDKELSFMKNLEGGDNLEELEELQDENERLKEELEEYKEKAQEYEEKVEKYREKEKTRLSEKIVDIRKNKGILDDDCNCDEEIEELKEFSTDVLEKLLKDAKKISKKLSEPRPQVNEQNDSKSYESKKEKLRKEMFGDGE